ncbi:hypothetical protein BIV57_20290 [Mangrovactinospora gilvigrisea]|uniref:Type II secretion system protein GspF domain-containing protein n=1 Tax=Mangrovactinospora gilvigrisea TaxID=1428644 RepID=A0A1J7C277_9ACTN|nr:type II secretion system F family protein [Mangrovactinospora gilvigrisea]OIV35672.1 hypothetical protein BIV57_20290 [Mangrovactinospora gilvigrisea]
MGIWVLGLAVGVGAAVWGWIGLRRRAPADAERALAAQLAPTAELLAAVLAAGAGPEAAASAVAATLGPPMAPLLGGVAAELRMGADPADCWARFGSRPGLAPLGRCLARAGLSGTASAAAVAALAARRRESGARAALAAARRAGVWATAPLGLCFLPAFLLVGVAPVVMGLAERLLGR